MRPTIVGELGLEAEFCQKRVFTCASARPFSTSVARTLFIMFQSTYSAGLVSKLAAAWASDRYQM
jgi:hypothetical protein